MSQTIVNGILNNAIAASQGVHVDCMCSMCSIKKSRDLADLADISEAHQSCGLRLEQELTDLINDVHRGFNGLLQYQSPQQYKFCSGLMLDSVCRIVLSQISEHDSFERPLAAEFFAPKSGDRAGSIMIKPILMGFGDGSKLEIDFMDYMFRLNENNLIQSNPTPNSLSTEIHFS